MEQGIVVKDTFDAARQSMYAYLGAYGFGNQQAVDYVCCFVTDIYGTQIAPPVVWWRQEEQTEEEQPEG